MAESSAGASLSASLTPPTKYSDLVNVSAFGKKREEFNEDRGPVSFYCRDCRRQVETDRPDPNGYAFVCKICGGKNVTVGTEEGLKSFYERPRF